MQRPVQIPPSSAEQDSSLNDRSPLLRPKPQALALLTGFLLFYVGGCPPPPVEELEGDAIVYPSASDVIFSIPFVHDIGYLNPDSEDGGVEEDTAPPPDIWEEVRVDTDYQEDVANDIAEDVIWMDMQPGPDTMDPPSSDASTTSCDNPTVCDDGNPCTEDLCISTGICEHPPTDAPCDDDNECTENDSCWEGSCVGDWKDCDDENPCTNEVCLPGSDCVYQNTDGYCGPNNNGQCVDGDCVMNP